MIFLLVVCLSSFTTNIVTKSMKISKNWNNVAIYERKQAGKVAEIENVEASTHYRISNFDGTFHFLEDIKNIGKLGLGKEARISAYSPKSVHEFSWRIACRKKSLIWVPCHIFVNLESPTS
eukprot:Pompholyxophrys_punicea_v1_NODE_583_length_1649_cov_4.335006.p5 type:complete len:121 gc:universal NODE_583_length_1649_cov_4.335006:706-1068(+)